MIKRIGVCTGNISIGGQERMLVEFLKILSSLEYKVELFIEEDKSEKNFYEKEIPENISYQFLTPKSLMKRIDNYKKGKNIFRKLIYSIDLMSKKKIAIKKLSKSIGNLDIIIDYNLGLLRTIHNLDLDDKKVVGWSHVGTGELLKHKQKHLNMNKYDYIVSVNEIMKSGYEKNYSNLKTRMLTITNHIDEDNIRNLSKENIKEKNLGEFILSVGSLTENKDFESLIIGYQKFIESTKSKLNLVILGEGKSRDSLINLINEKKLMSRVFLLGNKSNPYKYIKECSYYVQSSKQESFSLVLVEAMVFGKILISNSNIGAKFVLKEGDCGILLNDIKNELAETILKLEKNENLRFSYSSKSYERGKDFYKAVAKEKTKEFLDIL